MTDWPIAAIIYLGTGAQVALALAPALLSRDARTGGAGLLAFLVVSAMLLLCPVLLLAGWDRGNLWSGAHGGPFIGEVGMSGVRRQLGGVEKRK